MTRTSRGLAATAELRVFNTLCIIVSHAEAYLEISKGGSGDTFQLYIFKSVQILSICLH